MAPEMTYTSRRLVIVGPICLTTSNQNLFFSTLVLTHIAMIAWAASTSQMQGY